MRYLNQRNIDELGISWPGVLDVVAAAVSLLDKKDYCQPIKPYLRFNDRKNRIIAMPAYAGGGIDTAGIKWIASFPDNIDRGLARAHSVVLLNDSRTGRPYCTINSAALSAIRTSGVSGHVIRKYLETHPDAERRFVFGIIGAGPIGQLHARLILEHFGARAAKVLWYDIRDIDQKPWKDRIGVGEIEICNSWEDVFQRSDVLITCTTSPYRYIGQAPRKGCLYLNVSLRDFQVGFLKEVSRIVVDDWDEVCRENTDIECAHKEIGLQREDVYSLAGLEEMLEHTPLTTASVLFNPMGMAVFDIAIARYYFDIACQRQVGLELED
jgi:ornithine cyclodeaminase